MSDLETLDELFEKARVKPETNWLEDIHSQTDNWKKTECPLGTEIFNWMDDDGYCERRGGTFDIDGLESKSTDTLTVKRYIELEDAEDEERTYAVDVEIFVYKDYIYTISSEHLIDAFTCTAQSITRRALKEKAGKKELRL